METEMLFSERGFLSPLLIASIAAAVVIGGLGIALKVQSARLESEKAEHAATTAKFEAFKMDTKRIGLEAQKKADDQKSKDVADKERVDAEHRKTVAALAADITKLRHDRDSARSRFLSASPSGSSRTDLACFDRAEYQRAYGSLVTGVRGLADEGTEGTVGLDAAKRWAQ
jgi:hypothetical protein